MDCDTIYNLAIVIYEYNGYQLDDSIARAIVPFKSKSCGILGNSQSRVIALIVACD